ncbi:hypothetical protein EJ06DRAFT_554848 [Trichodelitschia bisporula]|uniref:Uncharacterized protein n=1 Tax=Trichodelitschia bisporula TaxID=703511 RepID=A0A6G1I1V3_9PEZI|nr:hypothetical protein EJ06DRAFT_554848 [Trichodelitschia bisporula]
MHTLRRPFSFEELPSPGEDTITHLLNAAMSEWAGARRPKTPFARSVTPIPRAPSAVPQPLSPSKPPSRENSLCLPPATLTEPFPVFDPPAPADRRFSFVPDVYTPDVYPADAHATSPYASPYANPAHTYYAYAPSSPTPSTSSISTSAIAPPVPVRTRPYAESARAARRQSCDSQESGWSERSTWSERSAWSEPGRGPRGLRRKSAPRGGSLRQLRAEASVAGLREAYEASVRGYLEGWV